MTVQELIDLLQQGVDDKNLPVFAVVGEYCLQLTSVEEYEDAVELWARAQI